MNPISAEELGRLSTEQKRALLKRLLLERLDGSTREYPLSYGQRALWFVHKLMPDSAAYHVAFPARLRSPLNVPAFERALVRLVERHPALRTAFIDRAGEPVQVVSPALPANLRQVTVPGGESRLREEALEDYRRPFDIERSLFRVTLFHVPGGRDVLLIVLHHLIFDAWSAQILFEDLRAFYESELRDSALSLPPLPAQYSDFVAWQKGLVEDPRAGELWDYWAGALAAPLPTLQFPAAGMPAADPAGPAGPACSIPLVFEKELVAGLRDLARASNATLYMVMLAAFQVLLQRHTGQDDILVGSPAFGRNQPQWTGVIGYFVNMLPIRADLSGNPTFAEHLSRTRDAVLGALAHQDFPFPLMVERLRLRRDDPLSPVIQAMFNLVASRRGNEPARLFAGSPDAAGVPFGDVTLDPYPIPQQAAQFTLVLEMTEADGMVFASLKYVRERVCDGVALAMARDYRAVLTGAVAGSHLRIQAFQLNQGAAEEARDDILL
jgi:hypothetical protein